MREGGEDGEEGGKEESLGVGNGERLGRGEVKVEEGWRKDGGDEEGNGEVGEGWRRRREGGRCRGGNKGERLGKGEER